MKIGEFKNIPLVSSDIAEWSLGNHWTPACAYGFMKPHSCGDGCSPRANLPEHLGYRSDKALSLRSVLVYQTKNAGRSPVQKSGSLTRCTYSTCISISRDKATALSFLRPQVRSLRLCCLLFTSKQLAAVIMLNIANQTSAEGWRPRFSLYVRFSSFCRKWDNWRAF